MNLSHSDVKVVPSGKVYSQLFEAQALLSGKLSAAREKLSSNRFLKKNPLLPKIDTKESFASLQQIGSSKLIQDTGSEVENEVNEVKSLPSEMAVVPRKRTSLNVLKTLTNKRKLDHDNLLEDLYQELGVISTNTEMKIEVCCQEFCEKIDELDRRMVMVLNYDIPEFEILNYRYNTLTSLWEEVHTFTSYKTAFINKLDLNLKEIESERIEQIKALFQRITTQFVAISYLTKPEVHRMIEGEVQIINQTLLNNKQIFSEVYTQLMMIHSAFDRKQHLIWKSLYNAWRNKTTQTVLERFRVFMAAGPSVKPPEVLEAVDNIKEMYDGIMEECINHIESMRNFVAPDCSHALVQDWFEKAEEISLKLSTNGDMYLKELETRCDDRIKKSIAKMNEVKASLIELNCCNKFKAEELCNRYLLPLVQMQQKNLEYSLELWTDDLAKAFNCTAGTVKKLQTYFLGIANLWSNHMLDIDNQEVKINQLLKDNKEKHNVELQQEELKLDTTLDVLRQASDIQALDQTLAIALGILAKIKNTYSSFHTKQVQTMAMYTGFIKEKLGQYEKDVCKFFKVKRFQKLLRTGSTNKSSFGCSCSGVPIHTSLSVESLKLLEGNLSQGSVLQTQASKMSLQVPLRENEIQSDTGQSSQSDQEADTTSLLTEVEAARRYVHIPKLFIGDLKTSICLNMVSHLDTWLLSMTRKAKLHIDTKVEEFDAELGLRNHLHSPRCTRIEEDIYDIRKEELAMHLKRVNDHCSATDDVMVKLRQKFTKVRETQDEMISNFENQIENMDPAFQNISKTDKLVTLRNKLTERINQLMASIRKTLRDYRTLFEKEIQRVKDSNVNLISSFRLFSAMGNFSAEEVNQYQKIVEKMALKLDAFEMKLVSEMELIEATRFDEANKIAVVFEDRFKNHVFDLQYIELLARWFTNTQVKIRCEVAKSNQQSKELFDILKNLDEKISGGKNSNLDEMRAALSNALPMFCIRALYLMSPITVVNYKSASPTNDLTPVCKTGKLALDDPIVTTTKAMLKSNKFHTVTEIENSETVGSSLNFNIEKKDLKLSSKRSVSIIKKHATPSSLPSELQEHKVVFEQMFRFGKIRKLLLSHKNRQRLFPGELDIEDMDTEPLSDLLGTIRQYLQIAFDNTLLISEDYYRLKGSRPVTRPKAIQENLEACTLLLKKKLKHYYTQVVEYHKKCQNEFSEQVQHLVVITHKTPKALFNHFLESHITSLEAMMKTMGKEFAIQMANLKLQQDQNRKVLMPGLGHPQHKEALEELNEKEKVTHHAVMGVIKKHFKKMREELIQSSGPFLKSLSALSDSMLLLYDTVIRETMKKEKKLTTPADLFNEVKNVTVHARNNWPGLSYKDFYNYINLECPFPKAVAGNIPTAKSIFPHHTTIDARNTVYQAYKVYFKKTLDGINTDLMNLEKLEERKWENWGDSINSIQGLYK